MSYNVTKAEEASQEKFQTTVRETDEADSEVTDALEDLPL